MFLKKMLLEWMIKKRPLDVQYIKWTKNNFANFRQRLKMLQHTINFIEF